MTDRIVNLLQETEGVITARERNTSQVEFVIIPTSFDFPEYGEKYCSWEEFAYVAKDINYDPGYGSHEISRILCIVGHNWWMTRGEYDGSEWWEFHERPIIPAEKAVPEKEFIYSTNFFYAPEEGDEEDD